MKCLSAFETSRLVAGGKKVRPDVLTLFSEVFSVLIHDFGIPSRMPFARNLIISFNLKATSNHGNYTSEKAFLPK
jgi:hypothetical protein